MPIGRYIFIFFCLGSLLSCEDPETKYATEVSQMKALRLRLLEMRSWMAIDDSLLQQRSRRMQQQDSLLHSQQLAQMVAPELIFSLEQYKGIAPIYENYMSRQAAIRHRLDSTSHSLDSLRDQLFEGRIGRRMFRDIFQQEEAVVKELEAEVDHTAKKVTGVEPTYRRIQPYLDSLETYRSRLRSN